MSVRVQLMCMWMLLDLSKYKLIFNYCQCNVSLIVYITKLVVKILIKCNIYIYFLYFFRVNKSTLTVTLPTFDYTRQNDDGITDNARDSFIDQDCPMEENFNGNAENGLKDSTCNNE